MHPSGGLAWGRPSDSRRWPWSNVAASRPFNLQTDSYCHCFSLVVVSQACTLARRRQHCPAGRELALPNSRFAVTSSVAARCGCLSQFASVCVGHESH